MPSDAVPTVRPGRASDAAALNAIHNHWVEHSIAVFDERPSTLAEREEWLARYRDTGPHRLFVAEQDGAVVGFASSQTFRTHPAFRECVETSVMLAPETRGRGLGTLLYRTLFDALRGERIHRVYAGIALPNPASCALHERFGFERIAVYDEYALKHGQYISSAWYEKRV